MRTLLTARRVFAVCLLLVVSEGAIGVAAADTARVADKTSAGSIDVAVVLSRAGIKVRSGRAELARSSCAARELLLQEPASRRHLTDEEIDALEGKALTAPLKSIEGVNVSVTCQMAYFVRMGEIVRVFPVSTGRSGHRTPAGTFKQVRSINGWHISTLYPGARMYRPMYFNGPIAFHGASSDISVHSYPASHGCVRTRHADVDWLWEHWGMGSQVRVYGSW